MEASVMMLLRLVLICVSIGQLEGWVYCFNCDSTRTTGCGAVADFELLLKMWRVRREAQLTGRYHNSSTISLINATHNVNQAKAPRGSAFQTPDDVKDVVGEKTVESPQRETPPTTPTLPTLPAAPGYHGGDQDDPHPVVVKCPGSRCLVQRQEFKSRNVFVRTCDVTDVPEGHCHLLTGVLGSRLSVVCVCSGNLCNGMPMNGRGAKLACVFSWQPLALLLTALATVCLFSSFFTGTNFLR